MAAATFRVQVCIICKSWQVSEPRNFAAGVAQPARGPRLRAPAPVPSACWGCVTLTFPYDTNCMDPSVQGSWAVWDGVMSYLDELRFYGVLKKFRFVSGSAAG